LIVFLTAFKAHDLADDWAQIQSLGRATIGSVLQQQGMPVKLITCFNDDPFPDEDFGGQVLKVQADFDPPTRETVNADTGTADKWKKLHQGLMLARTLNPDWVMLMDCDDLLSNQLVPLIADQGHRDHNGFIVNLGYRWRFGAKRMRLDPKFSCGTNAIHNVHKLGLPDDRSEQARADSKILSLGHTIVERDMAELGMPMTPTPFPGVMNVRDHGENVSHVRTRYTVRRAVSEIRAAKDWRLVKQSHRTEFNMDY